MLFGAVLGCAMYAGIRIVESERRDREAWNSNRDGPNEASYNVFTNPPDAVTDVRVDGV